MNLGRAHENHDTVFENSCKHYRSPWHFIECGKGINYRELAGGKRFGYMTRIPCVRTSLTKCSYNKCKHRELYSKKELKKIYSDFKELYENVQKAWKIASGEI